MALSVGVVCEERKWVQSLSVAAAKSVCPQMADVWWDVLRMGATSDPEPGDKADGFRGLLSVVDGQNDFARR